MKYIIIGLGNFGSTLAQLLTEMGNEVIGVDNNMGKIESLKEKITHTICLNSTDALSVENLPIRDTDVVMVCIGENEGANLMTTALMKQYQPKRLISRAVSPLHQTILEAMGVTEIIHPEEETAIRWAKKLNIKGVVESFELCDDYNIVEVVVPERYINKTLGEVELRKKYDVLVLTTIKMNQEVNTLGVSRKMPRVKGVASAETVLEKGDLMVLYGHIRNIKKLLGT
ncbi:MAG: TrkA family potassium uptake protein [Bacteroidia bacterium]|nr:TrkA family potassium uptake protein [Bacteroidia bacterium]